MSQFLAPTGALEDGMCVCVCCPCEYFLAHSRSLQRSFRELERGHISYLRTLGNLKWIDFLVFDHKVEFGYSFIYFYFFRSGERGQETFKKLDTA